MDYRQILKEREQNLIEVFEWIEDDMARYETIIDIGKNAKNQIDSDNDRIETNEVKGCQSKVWITHKLNDGLIYFRSDSNTVITKGIAAIVTELWSGLPPSIIAEASTQILDTIGLRKHLTSQRNNGLNAMIAMLQDTAKQYL